MAEDLTGALLEEFKHGASSEYGLNHIDVPFLYPLPHTSLIFDYFVIRFLSAGRQAEGTVYWPRKVWVFKAATGKGNVQ